MNACSGSSAAVSVLNWERTISVSYLICEVCRPFPAFQVSPDLRLRSDIVFVQATCCLLSLPDAVCLAHDLCKLPVALYSSLLALHLRLTHSVSAMCGIAALLLAPTTPHLEQKLHNYAPLITSALQPRGPDAQGSTIVNLPAATNPTSTSSSTYSFLLAATVLHLRGPTPTAQPFTSPASVPAPLLCFNGEIYHGLPSLTPHSNDTAALYELLSVNPHTSPLLPLSTLDAEYAFTYYQPATATLWFGKDVMGRRSLLAAMGEEGGLCVASVVLDCVDEWAEQDWTEVPISGIFSVDVSRWAETAALEVWLHYWPHVRRACPELPERKLIRSMADALLDPSALPFPRADLLTGQPTCTLSESVVTLSSAAERLGELLSNSVRERVTTCPPPSDPSDAAIAILFSGGLDCTLLAHYAHLHTPPEQPIDLINVAFIGQLPPTSALHHCPDRITAYNSLHSLTTTHPTRHYRLLCVDVTLAALEEGRAGLVSVVRPCGTVMDFNIAVVLGYGARGVGYVVERVEQWIESRYGRYRTEGGGEVETKEAQAEDDVLSTTQAEESKDTQRQAHTLHTDDTTVPSDAVDDSGLTEDERRRRTNPLYGYKRTPAARKANIARRKQLVKQQRRQQRHGEGNEVEEEVESVPTAEEFAAADGGSGQVLPGPMYTSRAKVLLVGIGADELFAGYARHRTTLRSAGEAALSRALSTDVSRLWLRNLGRDDRVTANHARELRTPFLSAPLIHFWHHLPLHALHTLPSPLGGKAVLREVARRAGLERVSGLEKRAMQFGSRVSNRRVVGWVRMSDSVQVREIVNPLFLREECRPTRVRGEIEKREAKRERDKRGKEKELAEDETGSNHYADNQKAEMAADSGEW